MLQTIIEADKQRHQHQGVVQVTEEYLARLHEREPTVQSFITVADDAARSSAADLDTALAERSGAALGPLMGVPVGVKVRRRLSAYAVKAQHVHVGCLIYFYIRCHDLCGVEQSTSSRCMYGAWPCMYPAI